MAGASVMSSLVLKPAPFLERTQVKGVPSLVRPSSSFQVKASGVKKVKTDKPFGINGGMSLDGGLDSTGRKGKGKGVYQFVDKYGANVDGYSPIYNENEWSPTGDVYVGGTTGLAIWADSCRHSSRRRPSGLQQQCSSPVKMYYDSSDLIL